MILIKKKKKSLFTYNQTVLDFPVELIQLNLIISPIVRKRKALHTNGLQFHDPSVHAIEYHRDPFWLNERHSVDYLHHLKVLIIGIQFMSVNKSILEKNIFNFQFEKKL